MFKKSVVKSSAVILFTMLFMTSNITAMARGTSHASRNTKKTIALPVMDTTITPVIDTTTTPAIDTTTTPAIDTTTTPAIDTTTTPVTDIPTTNLPSTINSVNIKDFGAHSIDESGYSTFDSSTAIDSAIQAARSKGITSVDFGAGRYYAKDVSLESNMTYFSTQGAELIASPDIRVWGSVLSADNKENITLNGLTINGNKDFVAGTDMWGSYLVSFYDTDNVTVTNCYLYNSWSLAIVLENNCNYVTIKNNEIYDTDCGIISTKIASNNILIDNNIIHGNKNQMSEPIAIYNKNVNGLAHDITITNNVVYGKSYASGILVVNATKVLIKGNTAYNLSGGITVGLDKNMLESDMTISNNITVTENTIYNCYTGIIAEASDSSIYNNNVHDITTVGIALTAVHKNTFSTNSKIYNNNITNVNSILGEQEPAIRLENTSNCTVSSNTVSDTRTVVSHYFVIQVKGQNANNNIVENNIELGKTLKSGYSIYIQNAKNTIVRSNKGTILDQGTANVLVANTIIRL